MKKEIPIIFSPPMVAAILNGNKTITRRIVQKPFQEWMSEKNNPEWWNDIDKQCRYGQPGDLLWVREKFAPMYSDKGKRMGWYHSTDTDVYNGPWKPSIHMPKAAARIWLEVVSVRVERLNNITEDDAKREGVLKGLDVCREEFYKDYNINMFVFDKAKTSFKTLWDSINGEDSWKQNPWVWVIEFKKIINHK